MDKKTIILTGGHAGSTAAVVITEIKRRQLNWKTVWIDEKAVPGKIQTIFTKSTLPDLFKIPLGLLKSFFVVLKIKPDLVLSFGGGSGSLVSFISFLLGIPVVIHEQTAVMGRGNKLTAKFAKKIAISRESSKEFFDSKKIVLTGNPINPFFNKIRNRDEVKTIFITGGSRGSEKINQTLVKILPTLLKKYKIIHQAGEKHAHKYRAFGKVDMLKTLTIVDIVIARAGANTVSEIIAAKKPSILIPIPWSYMNEQTKNAEFAESLGVARIISQNELTPEGLEIEIEKMVRDYPEIIKKIKNIVSPDLNASKKLVDLLVKLL